MADTKEILLQKICKAEREAAISGDTHRRDLYRYIKRLRIELIILQKKSSKKVSKGG